MQKQVHPSGYDFSFGNSIQSLKKLPSRPYFQEQDPQAAINNISDTPKFAKIKQQFRTTKKQKSLKRKDSEESLFGKNKNRSKSEIGFHFSLSANKTKIDKIEINCNNYTNKTSVTNYQRPRSYTPRVMSRQKYQRTQSNLYTPKGAFFSYYLNPSKSQLYDTARKITTKQPFQRKTFNRKQYIDRKLNNTKLTSQTSFSNKKGNTQIRPTSQKKFKTIDVYLSNL